MKAALTLCLDVPPHVFAAGVHLAALFEFHRSGRHGCRKSAVDWRGRLSVSSAFRFQRNSQLKKTHLRTRVLLSAWCHALIAPFALLPRLRIAPLDVNRAGRHCELGGNGGRGGRGRRRRR